jgi:hypothetical protein
VHGSGPGYFGQFLYIPSRCEGESRAENPGISAGSVVRVGDRGRDVSTKLLRPQLLLRSTRDILVTAAACDHKAVCSRGYFRLAVPPCRGCPLKRCEIVIHAIDSPSQSMPPMRKYYRQGHWQCEWILHLLYTRGACHLVSLLP